MPRKPQPQPRRTPGTPYPTNPKYPHVELPPAPTQDKYVSRADLNAKPWREAEVLRHNALDHERYGSRQPDGSVKPFSSRLLTASTNIRPGLSTASWVDRKPKD